MSLIDADRAASLSENVFRKSLQKLTEELQAAKFAGEALQDKALAELRKVAVGCFIAGTLVHTKDGLKPIEQIQVGDLVLSRPDDPAKGNETGYKRVTKTFRFEDKEIIRFVWSQNTPDGVGALHSVFATPNHPVWSHPHGWVPMGRMHMVGRGIPGTVPISDEPWWGRDLVLADGTAGERYDVFDLFQTDRPEVAFDNDEEGSWGGGSLIDLSAVKPKFSPDVPYDYEKWGDPVNETRQRYTTTVYNLEVDDWHTYFVGEAGLWVHNTNCEDPLLTVAAGKGNVEQLLQGVIEYGGKVLGKAFKKLSKAELNAFLRENLNVKEGTYKMRARIENSTYLSGIWFDEKAGRSITALCKHESKSTRTKSMGNGSASAEHITKLIQETGAGLACGLVSRQEQ